MQTVFSHIVQKRFSQENEDVATDALAFILHSSESAQKGIMRLFNGIVPDMPSLMFRTQKVEGCIRPDMWGYDKSEPRVYVENKFWASLTDNQPVSYLQQLTKYTQPTILLVVVPEAREQTLWRELSRRLENARITSIKLDTASGIVHCITTELGPILALTSWTRLLSILELEVADDPSARSDLLQLRALCEAADNKAFIPISPEVLTDQRTPAFILQLSSIVQASVDLAVSEGILNINRLMPQADQSRIGRYARFADKKGIGIWIGTHFGLWKKYGATPLWLFFHDTYWGCSLEVKPILESWAAKEGIFTTSENDGFAIAIDIVSGEDKDLVIRCIVDSLKGIADELQILNTKLESTDNA